MSSDYLHLDGLYTFANRLADYGYDYTSDQEDTRSKHSLDQEGIGTKRSFLCRVTVIAQAVLILIQTTGKQSIRGLTFLLSGILTLDGARFKIGMKDFVSVIVQSIALPILGLVAVATPHTAARESYKIAKLLNPNWINYRNSKITDNEGFEISYIDCQKVQAFDREPIKTIEWTFLPLQSLISSSTTLLQDILCLQPANALKQLGYLFASPFTIFSCLPKIYISEIQGYILKDSSKRVS
jgi:hypothetical protein